MSSYNMEIVNGEFNQLEQQVKVSFNQTSLRLSVLVLTSPKPWCDNLNLNLIYHHIIDRIRQSLLVWLNGRVAYSIRLANSIWSNVMESHCPPKACVTEMINLPWESKVAAWRNFEGLVPRHSDYHHDCAQVRASVATIASGRVTILTIFKLPYVWQ